MPPPLSRTLFQYTLPQFQPPQPGLSRSHHHLPTVHSLSIFYFPFPGRFGHPPFSLPCYLVFLCLWIVVSIVVLYFTAYTHFGVSTCHVCLSHSDLPHLGLFFFYFYLFVFKFGDVVFNS